MLGELFYLFKNYGDAIAQSYNLDNGMFEFETNMSGNFVGFYRSSCSTRIFHFNNVKDAIQLFRKEIERLRDG